MPKRLGVTGNMWRKSTTQLNAVYTRPYPQPLQITKGHPRLVNGSTVRMDLNLTAHTLDIFVNGANLATLTGVRAPCCWVACFGGSGQIVKLESAGAGSAVVAPAPAAGVGGAITWDAASLGPDCVLSAAGCGVTRTDSSGWGTCRSSRIFQEGETSSVTFVVVNNDSDYL